LASSRQLPATCESFRRMPDALERAAELDKQYGRKPDLAKLPMYCTVVAVKDWYDVKDMRSTGGNDVNYAMDAPPRDSTLSPTCGTRARSSMPWPSPWKSPLPEMARPNPPGPISAAAAASGVRGPATCAALTIRSAPPAPPAAAPVRRLPPISPPVPFVKPPAVRAGSPPTRMRWPVS